MSFVYLAVIGCDKALSPASANVIQAFCNLIVAGSAVIIEEQHAFLFIVGDVRVQRYFMSLNVKRQFIIRRAILRQLPTGKLHPAKRDFQLGIILHHVGQIG